MSNINALIAAGPQTQGIDVRGNALVTSRIKLNQKRNELLDIGIANAPAQEERAQAQESRLQSQEDRLQKGFETIDGLRQGISLMRFIDSDTPDIEGAINFVAQDGVTENEQRVIDMLQSGDPAQIEALRTGTKGLIETALLVGDIEQPAAAPARKTIEGADGFKYFVDDQSRVLPDVQAKPETSEGGDVRSRKIADAIRLNPDLSEQQATKIVDGQASIKINENTGKLLFTDDVAGTVTEIQVGGDQPETPAPEVGQTLRDLSGIATGPVSTVTAKTAAALSFFGIDTDEASTGAQQTFRTHTQSLIRALAINPRFPVAEMNRIKEEISIQPSMFQGEGTLNKKIDSLDESLQLRLDQAERDFNDPNLDVKTRQAQGANASALKNFLAILGGNPEEEADPIMSRMSEIEARLKEIQSGN